MLSRNLYLALCAILGMASHFGCQQKADQATEAQTSVPVPAAAAKPVVNDFAQAKAGDPAGNYNMAQVWAWGQLRLGLEAFATSHGRWPTSLSEMKDFEVFRFPVGESIRPDEILEGGGVTLEFVAGSPVIMRTARFQPDHSINRIEHTLTLDRFIQPRTNMESVPENQPREFSAEAWEHTASEALLLLRGTSPEQGHLLAVGVLETWQKLLNGYHRLNGQLPQSREALESTFPLELRENPFITVIVASPQEVLYVVHPDDDPAHDLSFQIEYIERIAQADPACPDCGSQKYITNVLAAHVGKAEAAIPSGVILDP